MLKIMLIILAVLFVVMVVSTVIALYLKAKRSTPQSKGEQGEKAVAKALGGTVTGKQYLINDLLFEVSGKTCQIDHVFINRNGVWVIETKNRAGAIYGDDSQQDWKQVLGNGSTVNSLPNPVKQNATHIYRLKEYLGENIYLHNAVVFLENADISCVQSDCVFSIDEIAAIKERDTGITLTPKQMEEYYNKLVRLKENSTVSREEHIRNIQKQQQDLQRGICPRCGKSLVLRSGEYGEFYGCSGYPDCKFIKPIDE